MYRPIHSQLEEPIDKRKAKYCLSLFFDQNEVSNNNSLFNRLQKN